MAGLRGDLWPFGVVVAFDREDYGLVGIIYTMFKRRRLGQVLSIHESCSSLCYIYSLVNVL